MLKYWKPLLLSIILIYPSMILSGLTSMVLGLMGIPMIIVYLQFIILCGFIISIPLLKLKKKLKSESQNNVSELRILNVCIGMAMLVGLLLFLLTFTNLFR